MSAGAMIETWARSYQAKTAVVVGPGREGEIVLALERAGLEVTHVKGQLGGAEIPPCDLLVVHHALAEGDGWRASLASSGKRAAKLVVVVAANPKKMFGFGGKSREACDTDELAPVLWDVGRVREHAYLGGPDVPAKLVRRVAPEHLFVVDTTPRTPQARRRLKTA